MIFNIHDIIPTICVVPVQGGSPPRFPGVFRDEKPRDGQAYIKVVTVNNIHIIPTILFVQGGSLPRFLGVFRYEKLRDSEPAASIILQRWVSTTHAQVYAILTVFDISGRLLVYQCV